jgi:SAM-dependent methyltransferase
MKSDQFEVHANIEERHWWFVARRRIMGRLVRSIVPPSKASVIADVGCGTGGNIAALAHEYSGIGIDRSAEAIEFARRRFPNVRFLCGSVPEDLGEVKDRADIFLLMDVLEHVEDDARFLARIFAVMKPGAHLLLTVPADMSLWGPHDEGFGHVRRYDVAGLQRLWAELPATPRLVSYYNAFLYPAIKALRAISHWRGRPWGEAGTDFRVPIRPINGILTGVFASEARRLVDVLEGRRERGFSFGVSFIAVLRREEEKRHGC